MPAAAIAASRLTKRFGSLTAVDGLSLNVAPGEIVGFLGPNGAGKTTTIRMLMGFLRPTSGSCRILESSMASDVHLRRRVGYLPGDFRMESRMTARDLFSWFSKLRGITAVARAGELTERLGLDPTRRFGELSKGNRQKVGIVQAFLHDPDVLILDEPTTGLDPLVQRTFLDLVREAATRGAAVLFSSHVLPEVEHMAHRVAMIRAGKLVRISTVEELFDGTRNRLQLRYAGPVPAETFAGVTGVHDVEVNGRTVVITVDGPVGPALHAASSVPGLLRVSNDGDRLEELFVSIYGDEA